MASYWRSSHTTQSSDTPLKAGGVYLFQLQDASDRQVLGAVLVTGVDDEGNAVGSVVDYVPKSVHVDESVFYVFAKRLDTLGVLSNKLKTLTLRYLDRQGAPWTIHCDHEGELDVVAQSVSYVDEYGRAMKKFVATYDEAVGFIEKTAASLARLRPDLTAADRYQEGDLPETITDSVGLVWNAYRLTDAARGAVGFYAMPNIFGAVALVGPSSTLVELRRDVHSFVDKTTSGLFPTGGAFGLGGEPSPAGLLSATTWPVSVVEDVSLPPVPATPPVPAVPSVPGGGDASSSGSSGPLLAVGAAAVLALLISRR